MNGIDTASQLIADDQLDELEDLWLARLTENSGDLEFFCATARNLAKTKETETAAFLLEMVDDQLREGQTWETRLDLLERSGLLYLDPVGVHEAAVSTLQGLYSECPSLEALSDKVGLNRAIEDTPKIWTKIKRLRSLMQFEAGTFVWMKDKGPGRVLEVNFELESFNIELNNLPTVRVGFAAAAKLLEPLAESHIERRKLEDLESLLTLKQEHPGELLLAVLQSHEDALTTAEIRTALTGVVEKQEWNGWWAAAKKHPQVLVTATKSRPTYSWAASEDHATEEVRQHFEEADVPHKLEILRKNSGRDEALTDAMVADLLAIADDSLHVEPDTALVIWYALDKLNTTGDLNWSPSSIIEESGSPASLVVSIGDRSNRERLYDLIAEVRSDWPDIFKHTMAVEHDPRLLTGLATRLGKEDPAKLKSVVDDILSHPRRRAAGFVWLAESGDSYAALTERNPLRLIRQILDAIHRSEFSGFKSRLHKTFETGGGATNLFPKLSEEQASQAESAIQRSPLEEHLRDSLIRYLHVRYPSLDTNRQSSLYATMESIEARRSELETLKTEEIPTNRRAIEEARELGDLRENFEYKSARQRHEYLNARLATLENDLSRVQPLAVDRIDLSEARVGCRLSLHDADGNERSVTILGPWESDPDRHIVSYDSDLGQMFLGKKPGDSVTIEDTAWTLKSIDPWTS